MRGIIQYISAAGGGGFLCNPQRAPVPLTFTAAVTTHFPVIFGTSLCMHVCVWSFGKLGWAYFHSPPPVADAAAPGGAAPTVDKRQVAEMRCQVRKTSGLERKGPAGVRTLEGVFGFLRQRDPCAVVVLRWQ